MAATKKTSNRLLLALHTRELKTAFFLALSAEPEVQIVATAVNSAELLTYTRAFQPKIIVMEWELPGLPVSEVIPKLTATESGPKIFITGKPSSEPELQEFSKVENIFLIDRSPEKFIKALQMGNPSMDPLNRSEGEE